MLRMMRRHLRWKWLIRLRKIVHLLLHFVSITGVGSAVVTEEDAIDNNLLYLCARFQSSETEQPTIRYVFDIDAILSF